MKTTQCRTATLLMLVSFLFFSCSAATAAEITVAAANSTCGVLKKAGQSFSQQQGVTIHYICKSSGMLAKGLESGYITADYFISASQKWVDHLINGGFMARESVRELWANSVIAVAAKKSPVALDSWDDLASDKVSAIFVGDPSTTPLGRQFKNVMTARGLWQNIRSKIVTKRHMSLVTGDLVAANETTIAILFPTSVDDRLKILLDMPTEWHEPIRYYGGPLLGSKHQEEAALFGAFLRSDGVNELFRRKGYLILP